METWNTTRFTNSPKAAFSGGLIGAVLGGLIGAIIWAVVGVMGYQASIVGLLIAFLTGKGYDLLKGRLGKIKTVVLLLVFVLAIILGELLKIIWYIHDGYVQAFAELTAFEQHFAMTEQEYFVKVIPDLMNNTEFTDAVIQDVGTGLLYGALGAFFLIFNSGKKAAKKRAEAERNRIPTPAYTPEEKKEI